MGFLNHGAMATVAKWAIQSFKGFIQTGAGAVGRAIAAKLLELPVTPQDFGAKGDGVTNDQAAMDAAKTAAGSAPVAMPAGGVFAIGTAAPDYDVRGQGQLLAGGVSTGGAELSYNPARESVFYAPATYQREVQGITYPLPRGTDYITSSYNMVFSPGSKLKDYGKTIRYVVAFGNIIGSSPLTWGYVDAFGGNALAYAGNVNRTVAIGSESLAWFGAPNQAWLVTYKHDFWRRPPDNPYIPGEAGWDSSGLETLFPGIGARLAAFAGYSADETTSAYTTTLGRDAGNHQVTGIRNVYAGYQAAAMTFSGSYNVGIGALALCNMVFGDYNTAVGDHAGRNCLDSTNATFVGYGAGRTVKTATGATILGDRAADNVTDAPGSVIIGTQAGASHPVSLANTLVIANDKSTVKPPLVSGDFSKQYVGYSINPEKIRARMHVRHADSGSVIVPANPGILVEALAIAAVTVETGPAGFGKLCFADDASQQAGGLEYSHASDSMDFFAGGASRMRLENSATLRPATDGVGLLGRIAYRWQNVYSQNVVLSPPASVTPANNGDVTFQLTSNTQLTIKVKGSDGTVRSVNLTLA
jgi:hypothetical protein